MSMREGNLRRRVVERLMRRMIKRVSFATLFANYRYLVVEFNCASLSERDVQIKKSLCIIFQRGYAFAKSRFWEGPHSLKKGDTSCK